MAKILLTYPLADSAIELLRQAGHSVTVRKATPALTPDELLTAVKEYDAILGLLTDKFSKEVIMAAGPQLKIIANYAVGYDNIDMATAAQRGIMVTNTPDVLSAAVAEHTVALIVAIARRIVEADQFTRAGKYHGWQPDLFLGTELAGKTLGIIGLGRIGKEVAARAKHGFAMKIMYNDLKPDKAFEQAAGAVYVGSVDELLPQVDVISLHVPLLPATHHLLNKQRLSLLKPTALVVNTARGPVIDEAALVEALRQKKLAGAALDVFEHEPALAPGLAELTNVIVTPHIASATNETRQAMAELAAKNILAVLSNQPPLTPVKA